MSRPVLPSYDEAGRDGYVRFFSFSAGEFLDDELFHIVARIAKFEEKTQAQVTREIEDQLEFKEVKNGPHRFQMWGSLDLLARIHKTRHVVLDGVLQ